jgi:hypothetical protein
MASNSFSIREIRTLHGSLSVSVKCEQDQASVRIDFEKNREGPFEDWILALPIRAKQVFIDEEVNSRWKITGQETHIPPPLPHQPQYGPNTPE